MEDKGRLKTLIVKYRFTISKQNTVVLLKCETFRQFSIDIQIDPPESCGMAVLRDGTPTGFGPAFCSKELIFGKLVLTMSYFPAQPLPGPYLYSVDSPVGAIGIV